MKTFRFLSLPAIAALALLLPACVSAQQSDQAPDPAATGAPVQGQWQGRHHRGGIMRMFRNLNLSDAQKSKIRLIISQYRQDHPRGSQPDPQAREQMRDQIMSVLTSAQQAQLKQQMEQMRSRWQQPQPGSTSQP